MVNVDLARSVAAAFELGELDASPIYVDRGAMGEIWRIDTAAGSWAVKAPFEWDPPPFLPEDIHVQLTASKAGIPLPRPALTSAGHAVAEVNSRLFRAYEWVDLAPPLEQPSVAHAAEAGRILGTIHSLPLQTVQPVDSWYLTAPDADRWSGLIARAETAGADWLETLVMHLELLADLADFVRHAQSGPPVVCHRDFDPSNVIPDLSGRLVTLDWENAGPLDPAAETAYALLAWTGTDGQPDDRSASAFLDGYTTASGTMPSLSRDSFSVAAATHLNFLAVMADQALDHGPHRSFAEMQVTRLLSGCEQLVANTDRLVEVLNL